MDNETMAYYLVHEPTMEAYLQRQRATGNDALVKLAHYADEAKWAYLAYTPTCESDETEERFRDRWLRLRHRFVKRLQAYIGKASNN